MSHPTCCLCHAPLGDAECCEKYAEMRVQGCAGCSATLIGASYAAWIATRGAKERSALPPLVAGFLREPDGHARPLCPSCFASHEDARR